MLSLLCRCRREAKSENFFRNGYPTSFFNKAYEKFHKRVLSDSHDESAREDDDFKLLLVIPFIHDASKISKYFVNKSHTILSHKYHVKLEVAYKSCELSSFFSLKDKTPLPLL